MILTQILILCCASPLQFGAQALESRLMSNMASFQCAEKDQGPGMLGRGKHRA